MYSVAASSCEGVLPNGGVQGDYITYWKSLYSIAAAASCKGVSSGLDTTHHFVSSLLPDTYGPDINVNGSDIIMVVLLD